MSAPILGWHRKAAEDWYGLVFNPQTVMTEGSVPTLAHHIAAHDPATAAEGATAAEIASAEHALRLAAEARLAEAVGLLREGVIDIAWSLHKDCGCPVCNFSRKARAFLAPCLLGPAALKQGEAPMPDQKDMDVRLLLPQAIAAGDVRCEWFCLICHEQIEGNADLIELHLREKHKENYDA